MSALLMTLISYGEVRAGQQAGDHAVRQRAGELFEQSRQRYQEGRFEDAAKLLEEAYTLDPAPTLLYNLARARENAGNLPGAVEAYERYLREDPKAEDRPAIARRVENLKAQIQEREELERLAASKDKPPEGQLTARPPPPKSASPLPWVLTGAGAAGVGVGVIFGVLAKSRHDQAVEEPIQQSAESLDAQAGNLAVASNIAYAAGGAMAMSGLIWGILMLTQNEGAPTAFLVPSSRGVALGARF